MEQRHFCLAEDRSDGAIGLRLAVAALARHEPAARMHVFAEALGPDIARWLDRWPQVVRHQMPADAAPGWSAKPALLRSLLAAGLPSVTWLDADVLATAPLAPLLAPHPPAVLVCAEEFYRLRNRGVAGRARAWGLAVGRELPFTVNSCVLRVHRAHLPLLDAWQEFISRPEYAAIQRRPFVERPFHAASDQDVLGALLGSAAFADVPVVALRQGRDIAQCFLAEGFSPPARLATLWRGGPPLVHAQGPKPWHVGADGPLYLRLSPYRYVARPLAEALEPDERGWLATQGADAVLLERLAFGNPHLAGLWPAVTALAAKAVEKAGGLVKRPGRRGR